MRPLPSSIRGYPSYDTVFFEILLEVSRSLEVRFTSRTDHPWLHVTPETTADIPVQGWKIHVSATTASAATVLNRVIPVVLERRVRFKFASSYRSLIDINAGHLHAGSAGKFITIYPPTTEVFVGLVQACEQATAGLDGPAILSDRRAAPHSIVQYRFGRFVSQPWSHDAVGSEVFPIVFPNGQESIDRRLPIFVLPKTVSDPIRAAATIKSRPLASLEASVRVGNYEFISILKRSNKGATYKAIHNMTAQTVIAKEALRHTSSDIYSRDAWYRLHNECTILRLLQSVDNVPRAIEEIEVGDRRYLFIEHVDGMTLRKYRNQQRMSMNSEEFLGTNLLAMMRLVDVVRQCHAHGVVVRDVNPNNVIIDETGRVFLVDLELAHLVEDPNTRPIDGATKGYASRAQEIGMAPSLRDDVFSIGACLYFVLTGCDPVFSPDGGNGRSRRTKMRDALIASNTPPRLITLATDCFSEDPSQRPTLAQFEAVLREPFATGRITEIVSMSIDASTSLHAPDLAGDARRLAEQSLRYLLTLKRSETAADTPSARLFPATSFGSTINRISVQSGASGIGLFVEQAAGIIPNSDLVLELAEATAAYAMNQTQDLSQIRHSPGLYSGYAGAAWYLYAYGRRVRDEATISHACTLALALPNDGLMPDISHGLAGIGLLYLRLYRDTGDREFAARAKRIARTLLLRAEADGDTRYWRMPRQFGFNQNAYLGYAHGSAGIGYFLSMAGHMLGEGDIFDVGSATIADVIRRCLADPTQSTLGYSGPDITWPYWCKGIAGKTSAAIRTQIITGDAHLKERIDHLISLIASHRSVGDLTQCHGMASIGEVLLDYRYLLQCSDHALSGSIVEWILSCSIDRRERNMGIFFPDEEKGGSPDYMIGSTGIASFVLRSLHFTPRLLMLDDASVS